jgi:hypothetical protein
MLRVRRMRFNGFGNRSIIALDAQFVPQPRIETLYLPYKVGVFAVCAATIIVASAVIWLGCFIVERLRIL